ncbi:beta-3-deoxy-D-manno-oct-2-ulosonic acid transferase [Acidithiobacillus sp. HP-6]|uniref:capsular polysaccharide export protein, LipB/KpsS family n=1 Tax=unclassified Acidithiobacillus TaxID=2614800 RepID=UPI001879CD1A|nr:MULTISPECIES: beta-3-deoxy-D-manno-oct-2-ulosonic acid transferase [unclassified Acidithiobacillus]MBE7562292.1 beta-3-deoxy-D-manno-oct-2-ulosonic acid transferase [Acidithiobacillus sp. HP-6]MBE7569017.1 beta-3-deoxy-D-manno-oct-2-ulosonic acid transferase [Acidithiobacillus sp. HP-2]
MVVIPADLYAVGFSAWKQGPLRAFLPETRLHFIRNTRQAPAGSTLLLWGAQTAPESHPIIRVEDGFLRSIGLGADLIAPLSYCFDGSGLYYDASKASDLEQILATHDFDATLLERAHALREQIVALGLTKYNVGQGGWQRPETRLPSIRSPESHPAARRFSKQQQSDPQALAQNQAVTQVILVVGQVESDASIALGSASTQSNLALLRKVREMHPDAYVVYKPHPDVSAGLRRVGAGEEQATAYCDEVVHNVSMHQLLTQVDQVHVMTSAAGFEALLRDKPVTCHGSPFYAGWGLTNDQETIPRRQRLLSLDALVAAALILYPRYIHPQEQCLCSPEAAVNALHAQRGGANDYHLPFWRKAFRLVLRQVVGVR